MARALVLMGLSLFMLQHAPVCARAAFRRLSLRATLDPSVTSELLDKRFAMKLALAHATKAFSKGEVPIGAVVLGPDGRVIGVGRNQVEQERDASAHAEIAAMRAAAKQLGNWRLHGCDLYVTMEPCVMCLAAAQQFRLRAVVYGCRNDRLGRVAPPARSEAHMCRGLSDERAKAPSAPESTSKRPRKACSIPSTA
mmetsp:Transcript_6533/g.25269  ORF Transcript_6533/g.25269 Transcript_6533/m.25269 type:complete len:196 (-) Transcript_6533:243-830(-)